MEHPFIMCRKKEGLEDNLLINTNHISSVKPTKHGKGHKIKLDNGTKFKIYRVPSLDNMELVKNSCKE